MFRIALLGFGLLCTMLRLEIDSEPNLNANIYQTFARMSDEDRQYMNGLHVDNDKTLSHRPHFKMMVKETPTVIKAEDLPEEFDARKRWPECSDVINNIRDQSPCGDCWAVAAAGVLSDRICIKSKGRMKVSISAIDIASCAFGKSSWDGCHGAAISSAWEYMHRNGVVTGGNYHSNVGCKPFPFPPTHDTNGKCHTSACAQECTNKEYRTKYEEDKIKIAEPIRLQTNDWKNMEHLIKQEVYANGSIEVGFHPSKDFSHHKGIYHQRSNESHKGHAVRLIGWGVDNGTAFWLIANSWGPKWGDQGFFRIRRGVNEAGIESAYDPYTGVPIL